MGVGGRGMECLLCNTTATDEKCTWQEKNKDGLFGDQGECICGDIGETCVSDFGIGFDIWWLFTLLNHLSLLCLGLYFLRQRQIEIKDPNASAKKKKISPMDKVNILTVIASFLRTLWVFQTYTGRTHNSQMFGNVGDALLVKTAQVVWLAAVLYLILVWKMLLAQSEKMTKTGKDTIAKLEKTVGRGAGSLFFVLIPVHILGTFGVAGAAMLADGVLILVAVYMVFKGIFFAKRLGNALSTGDNVDESRKALVATINKTIYVLAFSTLSGTAFSVYLLFLSDRSNRDMNPPLTLAFWFYFHFLCEGGICFSLYIMKLAQKANKVAPLKNKTGKTTAGGTMVEGGSEVSGSSGAENE